VHIETEGGFEHYRWEENEDGFARLQVDEKEIHGQALVMVDHYTPHYSHDKDKENIRRSNEVFLKNDNN
jgi:hypothetical protein